MRSSPEERFSVFSSGRCSTIVISVYNVGFFFLFLEESGVVVDDAAAIVNLHYCLYLLATSKVPIILWDLRRISIAFALRAILDIWSWLRVSSFRSES
jgi:hypothetical protein